MAVSSTASEPAPCVAASQRDCWKRAATYDQIVPAAGRRGLWRWCVGSGVVASARCRAVRLHDGHRGTRRPCLGHGHRQVGALKLYTGSQQVHCGRRSRGSCRSRFRVGASATVAPTPFRRSLPFWTHKARTQY